jgi:hypothetical protein
VLRVAGAAPAETPANPDYYDDDEFVPASEKENFDVFDWQLCKVREGPPSVCAPSHQTFYFPFISSIYATSRKVAGSIPDEAIGFFN